MIVIKTVQEAAFKIGRRAGNLEPMNIARSFSYVSALTLFVVVLLIDLWLAKPFYNWDLLGYVGVAIAYSEKNPEVIHAQTFSTIKAHVPQSSYVRLTTANAYQTNMAEHPEYFVQQLPFYRVKPLYPDLMILMNVFGLNLVSASLLISKLAYLGIGLLLYIWVAAVVRPPVAFAVASLMVSVSYVFDLARYSTPDGLSTLIILAAFFLLIERRDIRSALALLTAGIAIRPDDILLLLIAALYIAVFHRKRLLWAIGSSLVGIAVYLGETMWAGSYGWKTLFYHSFVQLLPAPSGFASPLSLGEYLWIYALQANPRNLGSIVLFILLNLLAIAMYYRQVRTEVSWFHLLMVNSLFMLTHWLLFPGEKDRQFVASYLLILMALTNATNLYQGVGQLRSSINNEICS